MLSILVKRNPAHALLLASAFAFTPNAFAGNWYAGGDIVGLVSEVRFSSGETVEFKTSHLRVKGGFEFTDWLAVEGQVVSPADDEQNTRTYGVTDYDVGPTVGIFAKPQLPLGPLDLYGLLGYSRTYARIDCTTGCYDPDTTLEGIGYGGGLQFYPTDRIRISADYMVYFDDDASYDDWWVTPLRVDQKNTAIGIGINYAFR